METLANINVLHQGVDANWEPQTSDMLNILVSDHHCIGTIFDKDKQKFVLLKSFYSEEKNTFYNHEWLKENFPYIRDLATSFFISFQKTVLVPAALFNEDLQRDFLELNYQLEKNDEIFSVYLKNLEAYLIYADDANIVAGLKNEFSNCTINHSCAGWLEYLASLNKIEDTNSMYIDIEGDKIDIAYFSAGALQLFNSFPCQTDEDKLYYTLFVSEQLKVNPAKDNYFISGIAEKDSSTSKMFGKYLKNFKQMESPAQFRYSLPVMTLPAHFYLKTFCSPLCV